MNSTASKSNQPHQPRFGGVFYCLRFCACASRRELVSMCLEGGWARAKPSVAHSRREGGGESARTARWNWYRCSGGAGANVLSDSTFLLTKYYVPCVPKHGTWIFFCSPLKTRMFPYFFILLFISVPMFQCSKKNTTDS